MADDNVATECDLGESVSVAGSRASARAEAAAEKQALIIKAKYAKLQNELELRKLKQENEQRLKQQELEVEMQQLQLTALIEAATAKETVLTAFEQGEPEPAVNDVVNVVQ